MYKLKGWSVPDKAFPYLQHFNLASQRYNLPNYLLIRLAEQESDYEPKATNPSGAKGMMQIIPRWHPEVDDPFDPQESIHYAAKYLRELHNRFGRWDYALMGYNWGPTNVAKWIKDRSIPVPKETQNYHREILRDVRNINKQV